MSSNTGKEPMKALADSASTKSAIAKTRNYSKSSKISSLGSGSERWNRKTRASKNKFGS